MSSAQSILITGGAGYIGSHTVLALLDAGLPVVVIDDLSTGRCALVPEDVPFIEGDVGDIDLVRKALRDHGCGSAMHFAGSIVNPKSFEIPLAYYANNTSASRTLIEACIKEDVRHFVFSSSAAIYGDPDILPIPETAPTNPISPYGRSKLMTEWMITDAAAISPMTFAMLRYFNVAGADAECRSGQVGPPTHLIKIAAEAALGLRDGISIFGDDYNTDDGTCIRDYIHVSDLARAHVLALEHLMNSGESLSLNCGYGYGYSVRQVIEAVERVAGVSLNATTAARRKGDAAALVADNAKILSSLPWTPRHDDLEFMIQTALDWERR
jgi:UDP-glucose 4-epimerase